MDILEVFWIIFIRYWTVDPENFFVKVKISKKKGWYHMYFVWLSVLWQWKKSNKSQNTRLFIINRLILDNRYPWMTIYSDLTSFIIIFRCRSNKHWEILKNFSYIYKFNENNPSPMGWVSVNLFIFDYCQSDKFQKSFN